MAVPYLPTEIFEDIITHLSSMKIWRFDSARKRDLQSLRLVSRRIKDIATPFLFENLRTHIGGLPSVATFCITHPELARHVQGLQVVMTVLRNLRLQRELHDEATRIAEVERDGEERARIFFNIIIEPFEKLLDQIPQFEILGPSFPVFADRTTESLITLGEALPNLKHFETTSSKMLESFFTSAAEKFYIQTGRMIDALKLGEEFHQSDADAAGYLGVIFALGCKIARSYTCGYLGLHSSFISNYLEPTEFFLNLRTLEIGFQIGTLTGRESKCHAKLWISVLNQLQNLSTLRLVLTQSMQDVHATPLRDTHKLLLDDLFLDYGDVPSDWEDGEHLELQTRCRLPKLKSVTFKNWVVTTSALHYFLYAHRNTLKSVTMERVSLRIPYNGDRRGWSFIARACQEHLLGLQDLRLSNLYTHEEIDLDRTLPPTFPAVVIVRRLHAEDYPDLDRLAFSKSGDGESGTITAVEDFTEPVDPMVECWWPEGSSG